MKSKHIKIDKNQQIENIPRPFGCLHVFSLWYSEEFHWLMPWRLTNYQYNNSLTLSICMTSDGEHISCLCISGTQTLIFPLSFFTCWLAFTILSKLLLSSFCSAAVTWVLIHRVTLSMARRMAIPVAVSCTWPLMSSKSRTSRPALQRDSTYLLKWKLYISLYNKKNYDRQGHFDASFH